MRIQYERSLPSTMALGQTMALLNRASFMWPREKAPPWGLASLLTVGVLVGTILLFSPSLEASLEALLSPVSCEAPLRTSLAVSKIIERDPCWSKNWKWLEAVEPWDSKSLVYMDIGSSLGYGVASVFGARAPGLGLNPSSLHGFLTSLQIASCGECGACKSVGDGGGGDSTPIAAYCIDAAPRNMKVISKAAEYFLRPLSSGNQHSLEVRNAYATSENATSSVDFPALCLGERCSVYASDLTGVKAVVPAVRVDHLAEEYRLPFIDILRVSVGGDEPTVLHSALGLLQQRRIGVIVFEFSQKGFWGREYTLKGVINALDFFGFKCFLAGRSATIPLTDCFVETFEELRMAEVVCSSYPLFKEQ